MISGPQASTEGTPVICRNCGGAMRLQGDMIALCAYCGARDQLPADAGARHLELRNRLSMARSRAAQLQGVDAALASIFEDRKAFFRVAGAYLVMGVIVLVMSGLSILQSGIATRAMPENLRASIWVRSLLAPCMMFGVAISLGLGLWGGRSHFRRKVRPLLLARPLHGGNGRFGCRVCGAEVVVAAEASVTCRYCTSINLLPASQHEVSVAALEQQAQTMQADVQRANVHMVSIAGRMRTIVIIGVSVSFLVAYVGPTFIDRYLLSIH